MVLGGPGGPGGPRSPDEVELPYIVQIIGFSFAATSAAEAT